MERICTNKWHRQALVQPQCAWVWIWAQHCRSLPISTLEFSPRFCPFLLAFGQRPCGCCDQLLPASHYLYATPSEGLPCEPSQSQLPVLLPRRRRRWWRPSGSTNLEAPRQDQNELRLLCSLFLLFLLRSLFSSWVPSLMPRPACKFRFWSGRTWRSASPRKARLGSGTRPSVSTLSMSTTARECTLKKRPSLLVRFRRVCYSLITCLSLCSMEILYISYSAMP